MRTAKSKPIFYKFTKVILSIFLSIVLVLSLFVVGIAINKKIIYKNLQQFSIQLFSLPVPKYSKALNHFRVVGSTSGMGDNRIYCAVLMLESTKEKEELQKYYSSIQFNQAQNRGLLNKSLPPPTIDIFSITEWNVVRSKFSNIEDDTVFSEWELQKNNRNCYLVLLTDGPYHSIEGENPRYEIHSLS